MGRFETLEAKLSELTALIKDLSPESRVEISFERYEDEDAHIWRICFRWEEGNAYDVEIVDYH